MRGRHEPIASLEELRKRVPAILRRINSDPELALRAAANPILAFEELGHPLAPAIVAEVERRIRYSRETVERLERLSARVHELAGEAFDVDAPRELERVLEERFALRLPAGGTDVGAEPAKRARRGAHATRPAHVLDNPYTPPGRPRRPDPLEALSGKHEVIAPLIEYRALSASQPPLAPVDLYERIRRHEVELPKLTLRARLSASNGTR